MLIRREFMDPSISTLSDSLREMTTGLRRTSFDLPTSTWLRGDRQSRGLGCGKVVVRSEQR